MSEVAADRPTDAEGVARWLERAGVVAVALPFVDPSAIVRVKTIPLGRFVQVAETGVGLSTLFNVAMSNDRFALREGFIDGPSGDLRLRPDPAATVPLAAMPGWAWAPVDQYTQEGEPFAACPRAFATAMASRVRRIGPVRPCGLRAGVLRRGRRDDGHVRAGTSRSRIQRHRARREPPVRARRDRGDRRAGTLVAAVPSGVRRRSVRDVDRAAGSGGRGRRGDGGPADGPCGRAPTRVESRRFAPRRRGRHGNGSHLHLSLWEGERNLLSGGDGPGGMDPRGEAFMAGILGSLPALVAIAAPTVASYLRLQPHHWSGAMQCWGIENREAALRFIAGTTPSTAAGANIEVKPVDGTANPYLAVGAMLAAGLDGLQRELRLPPSTEEDPTSAVAGDRRSARRAAAARLVARGGGAPRRVVRPPRGDGGVPVRDVPRDATRRGRGVRRPGRRRGDPTDPMAVLIGNASTERRAHDEDRSDRRRRDRRALPSVPQPGSARP